MRAWVARLVLLVLSLLVAALIVEAAATAWLHLVASEEAFRTYASLDQLRRRAEREGTSLTRFVPHRYVGFVPAPGFRRGSNFHNQHGLRGESFPRAKPAGELRIAALGGSTTYTSFVEDATRSYPARLQAHLHRAGLDHVRVLNAGAPGWTSWETLANFELRLLDFSPDILVVYHGINDALVRLVWPPGEYRGDNTGWLEAGGGWFERPPPLRRSNAWRIFLVRSGRIWPTRALDTNFARLAPSARFWKYCSQVHDGSYPSGLFARVSAEEMLRRNPPRYFRRNLAGLVALARQRDIQVVLASFAVVDGFDHCLSAPAMRMAVAEHNEVLEDLAGGSGTHWFDYSAVAPRDPLLYFDPVHLYAEGADRKARLFADFLLRSGLLAEPPGLSP